MSDAIRPFQINIPASQLGELQQRLALTRWPEAETVDDWSQGVPLAYCRELAQYWATDYDWRKMEHKLNSWEQFKTLIDGIDIHFIHCRSKHAEARPLIISHGWPGSVVEFHKVMAALTDPTAHGGSAEDAFHVVAPSLPGYGFSDKPAATGTSVTAIAGMWARLMSRLGYQHYFAQGGDWGSMITLSLGQQDPGHCDGIHVNMPIVAPDPATMDQLSEQEQAALEAMNFYQQWDSGYSKQQATRPQTVAYALADSPAGQLAWIVEKFYAWTDCERDGVKHPEHILGRDELLDNVMIYWLNNAAASSARLYWESFHQPDMTPVTLPVGCSMFPHEIFRCSQRWARGRFPALVYWGEPERGGHFAAFEQPELFVAELRKCFGIMRANSQA